MPRGFVYPQSALELFDWWVSEFCQAGTQKRGGSWWQARLGITGPFAGQPPSIHRALLEIKRVARPAEHGGMGQLEAMCVIITEERLRIHARTRETNGAARLNLVRHLAQERIRHLRDFPADSLAYARCNALMDFREDLALDATINFEWAPLEHDDGNYSGTTLTSESGSYPSSMIAEDEGYGGRGDRA